MRITMVIISCMVVSTSLYDLVQTQSGILNLATGYLKKVSCFRICAWAPVSIYIIKSPQYYKEDFGNRHPHRQS